MASMPAGEGSSPRVRGKPRRLASALRALRLIPARAGKTRGRGSLLEHGGAHPRACGENALASMGAYTGNGSSPRVRGKHPTVDVPAAPVRLIPARAGKTSPKLLLRCGRSGSSPRVRGKHLADAPHPAVSGLIPARAGKTRGGCTSPTSRPAHPRACGENTWQMLLTQLSVGSSPRVRGKRVVAVRPLHQDRLIPARAGKTSTRRPSRPSTRAHPRACGENDTGKGCGFPCPGSSPRVRGKRTRRPGRAGSPGLIPARAGKTSPSGAPRSWGTAHPRACGENGSDPDSVRNSLGSSPRVRGKLLALGAHCPPRGLIPARAGKTPCGSGARGRTRAHPRACGENKRRDSAHVAAPGSSPRVRGKRLRLLAGVRRRGSSPRVRGKLGECQRTLFRERLIPARAGKTPLAPSSAPAPRAHPRACGENADVPGVGAQDGGSSPRVRGKRPRTRWSDPCRGLIPARAGKTPGLFCSRSCGWAHPRACGENMLMMITLHLSRGSSPRVRGKRRRRHQEVLPRGLIPARAGKTMGVPSGAVWWAAHPRACGENGGHRLVLQGGYGSSPRVRGKPHHGLRVRLPVGLIPARAGKTDRSLSGCSCAPAHPRACGENDTEGLLTAEFPGSSPRVRGKRAALAADAPAGGSSPRVRGKLVLRVGGVDPGRLIPARAGKTHVHTIQTQDLEAHPRACGEN